MSKLHLKKKTSNKNQISLFSLEGDEMASEWAVVAIGRQTGRTNRFFFQLKDFLQHLTKKAVTAVT